MRKLRLFLKSGSVDHKVTGVEDLIPIPRESEDTSGGGDSEKFYTSQFHKSLGKRPEDIECKVSYDSNLDESTFLVTPLFDSNEDEFFTLRDDIELLLHHDLSTPMISVASILEENDWKKILYDAPIDDLITEDKVFDPGIHEKSFSLTFVKLTFEDRHYFPITFVIRIFLPYLTYSVDSPFLLSSGSEVTDIAQKDKNEAKRTKPSTGMERVREVKAEGVFEFNGPTCTHFIGPGGGGEVNRGGVDLGVSKQFSLELIVGDSGGVIIREVGGAPEV
ncbi:hypothetical protein Tco_1404387 [Tanacetum coccineum]